MRTSIDCIPCFIRQALDALRMVTRDERIIEASMRRVLEITSLFDMEQSPPEMARTIHQIIREHTGAEDPYRDIKKESTSRALTTVSAIRQQIQDADDPLEAAVRFSIAGNIMDFAMPSLKDMGNLEKHLKKALSHPLTGNGMVQLQLAISKATSILILGDNAGETVLDRLLIEQLPAGMVTYAVKGSPIINDATMEDAMDAGLHEVATIIDNGTNAPGTVLNLCSEEFKKHFYGADVVIAKGQANYETLSNAGRDVFFLTQVKCPVIAMDMGSTVGDWVVAESAKFQNKGFNDR